jgi:ATP-dependent Lhr-like helicase
VLAGGASRASYLRGIGTILDEPAVVVQTQGRPVGKLDGRFAALLEVGDRFALAGSVWRVVLRTSELIEATRDASRRGAPARWSGSRQPRSELVAARMESLLGALDAVIPAGAPRDEGALARAHADAARVLALGEGETSVARALVQLVLAQRAHSAVPAPGRFVIEALRGRGQTHLVLHTFAGAGANEVLGRALASRMGAALDEESLDEGSEFACTDEGLVVTLRTAPKGPALEASLRRALDPRGLYEDALRTLEGGSLARSHFREVARIAQLTPSSGRPGAASPSLLYDVLRKHAPSHLLLRALSHTLWSALDGERAVNFLSVAARRPWHVVACTGPSPLAIPVFARGEARRDRLAPDDLDGALVEAAHALYLRSGGAAAMP